MGAAKQDIAETMWEHEAIREHMKFLIKRLNSLANQPGEGRAQSTRMKEQITLYRWSLYDFREAIRRHINLDERVFETLPANSLIEDLVREHKTIQKKVDDAISLAEKAVYSRLSREGLSRCASDITIAVSAICESIEAHIGKEDGLLKLA